MDKKMSFTNSQNQTSELKKEKALFSLSFITPKKNKERELAEFVSSIIQSHGFELVDLILFHQKHKKIQVFIDVYYPDPTQSDLLPQKRKISIEDCVKATNILNEALDENILITDLFGENEYELEVSSPGIERPLTQEKDFIFFQGERARVYTIRTLSDVELNNAAYAQAHPKQKNFCGILLGLKESKIRLSIPPEETKKLKKGQIKKVNKKNLEQNHEIEIPISLITKAHLEPSLL